MRPPGHRLFGVRVGPRPKKRPSTFTKAVTYNGQPSRAPFFVHFTGQWADIVARPQWPGEIVPGLRIAVDYWDYLTNEYRKEIAMGLRKPTSATPSSKAATRPSDGGSEQDMPTLFAYLCDDVWEDGSSRQRSSLILFCEDDNFKACLTDKDSDMTLWVASKTLVGLFGALEARLNDPEAEWRKRKGPAGPQKRKA